MRFSVPLIFLAAASSIFAAPVPAPSESVIPSNDFSDVPTASGSYDVPSASSSDFALTSQEKSFLGNLLGEAISTSFQVFGSSKRDLGEEDQVSSSSSAVFASGVISGTPTASSVTVASDDVQSKSFLSGFTKGLSVFGTALGLLGSSSSSNNNSNKKRDVDSTVFAPSSAVSSGVPTASSVTVASDDVQSKSFLSGFTKGLSVFGTALGLLGSSSSSNSNSNKKRDIIPSASVSSASSTITDLSSATVSIPSSSINSGIPTASSVTVATDDVQSKKGWLSGIATGISVLGTVGGLVSGLVGSKNNDSSSSSSNQKRQFDEVNSSSNSTVSATNAQEKSFLGDLLDASGVSSIIAPIGHLIAGDSSSSSKREYVEDFAVPSVDIPQPSYIAVTFTA
ncbi:unnamed protein product [Ambrosiozyma monospora]|uniref:Unnamed protein product n=1 Tax=Ambrosiozyma monospora TaxID=43982 RepID=A0ACB5T1Q1_AMBMO|nr:unnamed protein product [Ambrosiozyma monospora]